jgi:hypothetical protein
VSDTNTGDNRIRVPGTQAGSPGAYGEEHRSEIRVPVDTLDHALVAAGVAARNVGVIWMDIQGHEAACLEGAGETLAAGMPVVTEFWPYGLARAGTTREAFVQLLARHFVRAHRVTDDRVTSMPITGVDALFDEAGRPGSMMQLILEQPRRAP